MKNIGQNIVSKYDVNDLSVATLASHSALQILHGAKLEGFRTIALALKERKKFYEEFKHFIDDIIVLNDWKDLCSKHVTTRLQTLNAILVPHGSYVEYVGLKCAESIELPLFGLRAIFRVEADQHKKIELLRNAGVPTPKTYSIYGEDLNKNRLVIVKLPGAKGGKGFFLANSREKITKKAKELAEKGIVKSIDDLLIQEYIIGVPAYYHFFYSPILNRLELLGADIRYESNIDGLRRLYGIEADIEPSFVVTGNIPLVLRESLLPKIIEYGYRFVARTKKELPPGIIGPFSLESIITDHLEIKVFEFSGRIVAGTNLYTMGSPYSWLYWNEPMSTGRRIAREIRLAAKKNLMKKIVT